jgi:hypothetical protein
MKMDEYTSYNGLGTFYLRGSVNHVGGKYVLGDVQTNTVEGFFATFKRGVYGIYLSISKKYLQRYLQEFSFQHNIRVEENGVGLVSVLSICDGRLLQRFGWT